MIRRFLLALVVGLAPRVAAAEGLKLEDAVRLALQNNERAKKAPLRVNVADASLERARDAFRSFSTMNDRMFSRCARTSERSDSAVG